MYDEKLKKMWPNIKKVMAFAWTDIWDVDKGGVMEGEQHNTHHGYCLQRPKSAIGRLVFRSFKASEKMALHLNDKEFALECKSLFDKGSKWIDANIFNGEYYEQHIPEGATKVAQLGKGCLVDQLAGQSLAHIAGLGYVLDKKNVQTTLKSIMKYNHLNNFNDHFNTFRSFALGEEAGLVMATYPRGEKLDFLFPYYTEVMTGFEYSTGAHMIYEGQVENGLQVFKDIRNRYDGFKRNPFNEGEYGHRYARAMAAWAGILAYTGFQYSAVDKSMAFNDKNGTYFWSNGYQYGNVKISGNHKEKTVTLLSKNGDFILKSFILNGFGTKKFRKGNTIKTGNEIQFKISR